MELIALSRLFRIFAYISLAVSLFFLVLVDFSTLWFVLGLFSLIFLVYLISFKRDETHFEPRVNDEEVALESIQKSRRVPTPSLVVLLVSVVFILAGNNGDDSKPTLGGQISAAFNISQIEARPSWQATFDVAKKTLVKDPLFGSGPNRFVNEWLLYKPSGVNSTPFWNTDFNYGIGLIPTFLTTTGILGMLAWVLFFLFFLSAGFKAILSTTVSDAFSQYLITSSFLTALFLWIFSVFYIPSATILAFTFLFTGLFMASLAQEKLISMKTISFIDDPRAGFVSVLVLILLLVGTVTGGYLVVQKYIASVYFQRGAIALNREGSVDRAEMLIGKAVGFSQSDVYYRALTEIGLIRMSNLFSQNADSTSEEAIRSQFQTLLGGALLNARLAVGVNPSDYQNFLGLGRVYEAVVPLKIDGAYENAKGAYEQALSLNPHAPSIYLTMARLETSKGDNAKARENISKALGEKNNYTEAIFLLSQIQVNEGKIKDAISSVEAASVISPNDSTVFFQLGLLQYNEKDWKNAAGAFERAVTLNLSYANAKYFLGLSYEKLGRDEEAIKQFQDLKASNPDNAEVDLILKNLQVGRAPFVNAAPPLDDQPQKRSTLPVSEQGTKSTKQKASVAPLDDAMAE